MIAWVEAAPIEPAGDGIGDVPPGWEPVGGPPQGRVAGRHSTSGLKWAHLYRQGAWHNATGEYTIFPDYAVETLTGIQAFEINDPLGDRLDVISPPTITCVGTQDVDYILAISPPTVPAGKPLWQTGAIHRDLGHERLPVRLFNFSYNSESWAERRVLLPIGREGGFPNEWYKPFAVVWVRDENDPSGGDVVCIGAESTILR